MSASRLPKRRKSRIMHYIGGMVILRRSVKPLFILLIFASFLAAQQKGTVSQTKTKDLDAASKERIIAEIAELVAEKYIFPDTGQAIASYLQKRWQENAYTHVKDMNAFLEALTKDMRAVSEDAHIGVMQRRGRAGSSGSSEEMYKKLYLQRAPFQNYGFKKSERMLGNVGCIVLDEFAYVELDGNDAGGQTARAAMQMLSNCYTLIIDLRDNFGGRDEMALMLLSYFFDKPEHILSKKYRGKAENEVWTSTDEAGGLFSAVPLYILTSRNTTSGGEMFAYVLKNRKRAVIVGEKTRGAAHIAHLVPLQDFNIDVAVPVGATIDPLTGADWEGKGVEPDIPASAGHALDVAYVEALKNLLQEKRNRMEHQEMEWGLMEAEAKLHPVSLNPESLREYIGVYGERTISFRDDALWYQRKGGEAYALEPMGVDLFSFRDAGMFYVRIRFAREASGAVSKMILLYDTGQRGEYEKDGR